MSLSSYGLRTGCAALTLGLVVSIAAPATCDARDLTLGVPAQHTSLDPHWVTSPAPFQVNAQIFEPLLNRRDDARPEPLLATSWDRPDDTTWIFHLRKDVKWHDGSPFTADDVVFTYSRAGNVPNSPLSFRTYLNQIKSTEAVDPHTLKITTIEPAPTLLDSLVYLLIVSRKYGEKATTQDYNESRAVIGTGPYKLVSWDPQSTTVLARNPDYWGKKQPWDKVTYKVMESVPTRLAALLAGDIDVAGTVPAKELVNLKNNQQVSVWIAPTAKIAYVVLDPETALDSGRVTGPNGEKLTENPFANPDVRAAMDIAIDRAAIAKFFFEDEAIPSGQLLPPTSLGHVASIGVPKGDPARATELLKKAGWHNKFKLEIVTSPTLFENAAGVAEAVAQSWTRIGIPTRVALMPYPILLKQRSDGKIAITLNTYQNSTGTADNIYPTLIHTPDLDRGFGVINANHYSNPTVDALIRQANATMDDDKRAKLYEEVTKTVTADRFMLSLFHLNSVHASRKGIGFAARADVQIRATNAWPIDADMPASKSAGAPAK